jgi:MYXO-CTERM domain-containing protein
MVTGGTPAADPAVVALVRDDQLVCTGTVVAPHVILTAAHCVSPLPAVVLGDPIAGATRHGAVLAIIAPGFDADTLAHDLALLVIADALPVAPLPYATSLGGAAVGSMIRVVGYGWTVAGDPSPPVRRDGISRIDAIDDGLHSSGAPSQICEGDSGGPALFGGAIIGVASSGDAACMQTATHTRVDLHADLIAGVIARTAEHSAAAGERCYFDTQCADSTCLPALDEPRWSFCAPSCADAACPAGLACVEAQCRNPVPSPGAEGAACSSNDDCAGALCLAPRDGEETVCTQRCFSDLPGFTCPAAERCTTAEDGAEACFAPRDDAGCRSTRDGGGALVLVALAAIARRRRRA